MTNAAKTTTTTPTVQAAAPSAAAPAGDNAAAPAVAPAQTLENPATPAAATPAAAAPDVDGMSDRAFMVHMMERSDARIDRIMEKMSAPSATPKVRESLPGMTPAAVAPATGTAITMDSLKNMTDEQINANWPAVQIALGQKPAN